MFFLRRIITEPTVNQKYLFGRNRLWCVCQNKPSGLDYGIFGYHLSLFSSVGSLDGNSTILVCGGFVNLSIMVF